MSGREIQANFSWARPALASDLKILGSELHSSVPMEAPWWTGGYESNKRAAKRVAGVGEWLAALSANASGATDDGTVVLLVTHGQTIEMVTNLLLQKAASEAPAAVTSGHPMLSTGGIRNTSVTGFLLPSLAYSYPGERPNANGVLEP
jgi:broad specificity phosphatase PhoE